MVINILSPTVFISMSLADISLTKNVWIAIFGIVLLFNVVMFTCKACLFYIKRKLPITTSHEDNNINQEVSQIVIDAWTKKIYETYYKEWTNMFEKITYPSTETNMSEITLLVWEIASRTMDYIPVVHNDVNTLENNKNSVNKVIGELSKEPLEDYIKDPPTVPYKVIAIAEWLKFNKVRKAVAAFGYKIS